MVLLSILISLTSCLTQDARNIKIGIYGDSDDVTIIYKPYHGTSEIGETIFENVSLPWEFEDAIKGKCYGELCERAKYNVNVEVCNNANTNTVEVEIDGNVCRQVDENNNHLSLCRILYYSQDQCLFVNYEEYIE